MNYGEEWVGHAPLVVWLASDESANVTGRTFFVSTGRIGLYSEPVEEKIWVKGGGGWTIDEMFQFMPTTLAAGLVNTVASGPATQKK
jgi:hypothetical protein